MKKTRILIVDDNNEIRDMYQAGLESRGFDVVPAKSVTEALRHISTEQFDVLLSDLHMPNAGDGFTVVSAMRHTQPSAVTLVLSGYPALQEAMTAILLEADEVLVKPFGLAKLTELIQKKLTNTSPRLETKRMRVAEILEHDTDATIENWMSRVDHNEELTAISLNFQERTGHLPLLLGDLVRRLHVPPDATAPDSSAAREHGILRRFQGYTVPMVVEESRLLQVSIFNTLQNNIGRVDFSTVLLDVMTIADEVDSQLKQAMIGFMEPPPAKLASSAA